MKANERPRVLIDLERLKHIHTGLGQVCLNFGKTLSQYPQERYRFVYLVPKRYIKYFGDNVEYETASLKRKYLPFLCQSYDLWYAIHQDSKYFPSKAQTPYLMTVHDLNFLNEKSASKAEKRIKRLKRRIDRSTKIVTISEYTKGVLLKSFDHLDPKDINVIYNGICVKEYPEALRPDFLKTDDFLLCLSVIRPKKNQKVLIDFIAKVKDGSTLVLAGNKDSLYAEEIENEIRIKGLEECVIMPGEVSDSERYWLYKHAKAVLFPSLYEGMGMPPIEAMRFGKPVFASRSSSIPEICGEYAYYWDDFSPHSMLKIYQEGLEEFYSDTIHQDRVIDHSMKFNWYSNVEAYFHLIEQVHLKDPHIDLK